MFLYFKIYSGRFLYFSFTSQFVVTSHEDFLSFLTCKYFISHFHTLMIDLHLRLSTLRISQHRLSFSGGKLLSTTFSLGIQCKTTSRFSLIQYTTANKSSECVHKTIVSLMIQLYTQLQASWAEEWGKFSKATGSCSRLI